MQRTACIFPRATLILQIRSTRRDEKPCYASFSPSMTDLRYAKHVKDCQCGFRELRETHDRTTARWPAAPWMLARAFAKHVKD